jgi:hypothetical protein
MKEKAHFFPSIGNIRPKFLSTIFKKPKWCITKAAPTPMQTNRKELLTRDAFNQEYANNNSTDPTTTHTKKDRNISARLSTAGLILSIFLLIIDSLEKRTSQNLGHPVAVRHKMALFYFAGVFLIRAYFSA